ncbi:MAG: hypothetical protein KC635_27270 [Myxococcales bacterium]|nr:hypothetical protein [Myxococcales bacterium]MCB9735057.1 hypothetical protein [Deltaproteobacteria bacterium]
MQMMQAAGGNVATWEATRGGAFGGSGPVQMSRPELEQNAIQTGPHEGRDPEEVNGRLPYTEDRQGWDHARILAHLTQIDSDPLTVVDDMRCSAAAMLGAQIPGGPARVAAVAERTLARMTEQVGRSEGGRGTRLRQMRDLLPIMRSMAGLIATGNGRYENLRHLACAMYLVSETTDAGDGLGPEERASMAELTPEEDRLVSEERRGWGAAEALFAELRRTVGQVALVGISTNGDAPGARINHNITVGFDGADIYVYDPWPRAGDQLMRLGSAERQIRVYFEQDGRPLNWTLERFVPAARAPGGRPAR